MNVVDQGLLKEDEQNRLAKLWWFFLSLPWVTWGASYGILVFESAKGFGGTNLEPRMMAVQFLCLGYLFLTPVPLILISVMKEAGKWTTEGIICAFIAGCCGLGGATFLSFAMSSGEGRTLLYYVMPTVFLLAPNWNCVVAILLQGIRDGHWQKPNAKFWIHLIVGSVAAGIALAFKPGSEQAGKVEDWTWLGHTLMVVFFFGAFGPFNYRGIQKLEKSPMRALLCACLAYDIGGVLLAIPFFVPTVITTVGVGAGLGAGASGFFGSFGVTMLNKTGMQMNPKRLPIINMPLVFIGCAFASVIGGLVWHPPTDWSFLWIYVPCLIVAAYCMYQVLSNNPEFLAMKAKFTEKSA
jgi:hypothetical protein